MTKLTVLTVSFIMLLSAGQCEPPPHEPRPWELLADWDHSWDAGELIAYVDDGTTYNTPEAVRVDHVPDPSGGVPLRRDDGHYQGLFGLPAAPGPIFNHESPSFNGYRSWRSDVIQSDGSFFDNFHSLLSPQTDKDDQSQWFGWSQPWWGAMLVAPVENDGGYESAAIDGDPGMTTMDIAPIRMRTWIHMYNWGPEINSNIHPHPGQSVLIMWGVNGNLSWLDVTYRDATGVHTTHVTGSQGVGTLNTLHSGWSHMNETATIGLAQGSADQETLEGIRQWAEPYLTV